jgi:putative transposase
VIRAHAKQFEIRQMCRWLGVSPSGFYAWQGRPLSERTKKNQRMAIEMRAIHAQVRKSYGSPRMHRELVQRGFPCSRHRIARLMRAEGLRAKPMKRFHVTTQSKHDRPLAPDRVNRNFTAQAPNRVWVSDITYVPTAEGWLYLAVILDLYSRRVVGWATSQHLDTSVVFDALEDATGRRNPGAGWILHSDRGVQYASEAVRARIALLGGLSSMGRKGDCFDNAVAESFFGSLKTEWVHGQRYQTRQEAWQDLFEYIELFYNPTRRHSTLKHLSPVQFEANAASEVH